MIRLQTGGIFRQTPLATHKKRLPRGSDFQMEMDAGDD
jgi:hypothetical protein